MNVTLANIYTKVRYLIQDELQTFMDVFEYNTTSTSFYLSENNIVELSEVYVNSESSGVTYTYDDVNNKFTVTSSLSDGDIVEAEYSYYNKYSDTSLASYVQSALMQLSIRNYKNFEVESDTIFPEPSFEERNLIAIIASIIIDPQNIDYVLPDMSVKAAKGSVPVNKMIDRVLAKFKKNSHGVFS